MRKCTKCGEYFPATPEYFHRQKHARDGLSNWCKKCHRSYLKSPEVSERRKAAAKTPERRAKMSAYLARPEVKARTRVRKQGEKYRLKERAYRHSARGQIVARTKTAQRRAAKKHASGNYTAAEWQTALDYFDGKCAVCGQSAGLWHVIAQDHWIPLDKGGTHEALNIVPLCHSKKGAPAGMPGCNNSKHTKLPDQWLRSEFGRRKAAAILKKVQAYFDYIKSADLPSGAGVSASLVDSEE